jgi:hypothetical protein
MSKRAIPGKYFVLLLPQRLLQFFIGIDRVQGLPERQVFGIIGQIYLQIVSCRQVRVGLYLV